MQVDAIRKTMVHRDPSDGDRMAGLPQFVGLRDENCSLRSGAWRGAKDQDVFNGDVVHAAVLVFRIADVLRVAISIRASGRLEDSSAAKRRAVVALPPMLVLRDEREVPNVIVVAHHEADPGGGVARMVRAGSAAVVDGPGGLDERPPYAGSVATGTVWQLEMSVDREMARWQVVIAFVLNALHP